MTDSIDRKSFTKEEIAKLRDLPEVKQEDRVELSDLPGWAQAALTYKFLYDVSSADAIAAIKVERSVKTLEHYKRTPAARKLREMVARFKENPVDMATAFLRANAMGVMVDRIVFLEMAKEAGNFVEADKIARDLQDRVPELAKKSASKGATGSMVIQVNLPGGASLEPIMIESEHKQIEGETEPDWEIDKRG